jgi:hypothetical protein
MNLLDGRNFTGIVLERGKTEGDADTITFSAGRFRSSACDRYEYGDGPYTASAAGDSVSFEARTESPKYGSLVWRGLVRGPARRHATMVLTARRWAEWVLAEAGLSARRASP